MSVDLQRHLVERLDQHPVESWPPHLARVVLNAMDLDASGELEGLMRVPTGTGPVVRIVPDLGDLAGVGGK